MVVFWWFCFRSRNASGCVFGTIDADFNICVFSGRVL